MTDSPPLTAEEELFLAETFDNRWMTRPVEECRAELRRLLDATRAKASGEGLRCDFDCDACRAEPEDEAEFTQEQRRRFLAATSTPSEAYATPAPAGLDVAWAEAEAALPKGWQLSWVQRVSDDGSRWSAVANKASAGRAQNGSGDSPAAALHDLAARLQPAPLTGERPAHEIGSAWPAPITGEDQSPT